MLRSIVVLLVAAAPDAGIADRLEAELRRAAPNAMIKRGDGTIQVSLDGGTSTTLGLDNLQLECASRPERCDQTIARMARVSLASLRPAKPIKREQLRACIKSSEWLATMRDKLGDVLVTRKWVGDLTVVYMVDLPDAVVVLHRDELKGLGLAEKQLDPLALANLDALLPQPTLAAIGGYDSIFAVYEGDDYCTSQLLFPKRFAPLAKKLGGKLILAAPLRNAMLVTGKTDEKTLGELRQLAEENARTQGHPLSTALFEWSPAGFRQLPPPKR